MMIIDFVKLTLQNKEMKTANLFLLCKSGTNQTHLFKLYLILCLIKMWQNNNHVLLNVSNYFYYTFLNILLHYVPLVLCPHKI
jgi:hypothetical protein